MRIVFRQKILLKLPSISQSNTFQESVYIQPRKKRRISGDVEKLVDLVNDRDPERAWPMIQISTVVYTKYPDCLNFEEYVEFLEIIIKLMNQSYKNFLIMESLCELATVFLYIEEKYEKEDLKMYWDKIWDAVLR